MQQKNDLKDSEDVLLVSLIPDFLVSLFLIFGCPVLFVLSFCIKTSGIFKIAAGGITILAILIGIWELRGIAKTVKKHFKQG
ncbi:hypothetical protein L6259_01735 [Candidatus Parcubacteria bacterium]|nr:hypothetical protein [Patescibacteria group bacterium]MCG2693977.1 hypothetical protein [Candidatus Parcubacteria bacterium]